MLLSSMFEQQVGLSLCLRLFRCRWLVFFVFFFFLKKKKKKKCQVGTVVIDGKQASAKQVYEAIEKEVGRIRVLYEIRPLLETRPLKKTGSEQFKGGETVELKIQIQWPR
jgi:hypothetical protein